MDVQRKQFWGNFFIILETRTYGDPNIWKIISDVISQPDGT